MAAYYNEHDAPTAAWLRELIKQGHIADGEVDERSIVDVGADDLRGFAQCHFFAGIGGWSYAMRIAGWPDDRPVWTGSCPCQPFSSAGSQAGGSDPRHLWPAWFRLIAECRPVVVFGEQVESAVDHGWLDLVFDDLEGAGYACGPADLPAAGVGAPNGRARVWFVGYANGQGLPERERHGGLQPETMGAFQGQAAQCRSDSRSVADSAGQRRTRERLLLRAEEGGRNSGDVMEVAGSGEVGTLADAHEPVASDGELQRGRRLVQLAEDPLAGVWAGAEWIYCRDEKFRPVEPGTFPLAHGLPARVGRLRGYGNAIVPQVAAAFIQAADEAMRAA
jgi:DNA (cytosine-5)-methyltransferase 1